MTNNRRYRAWKRIIGRIAGMYVKGIRVASRSRASRRLSSDAAACPSFHRFLGCIDTCIAFPSGSRRAKTREILFAVRDRLKFVSGKSAAVKLNQYGTSRVLSITMEQTRRYVKSFVRTRTRTPFCTKVLANFASLYLVLKGDLPVYAEIAETMFPSSIWQLHRSTLLASLIKITAISDVSLLLFVHVACLLTRRIIIAGPLHRVNSSLDVRALRLRR